MAMPATATTFMPLMPLMAFAVLAAAAFVAYLIDEVLNLLFRSNAIFKHKPHEL